MEREYFPFKSLYIHRKVGLLFLRLRRHYIPWTKREISSVNKKVVVGVHVSMVYSLSVCLSPRSSLSSLRRLLICSFKLRNELKKIERALNVCCVCFVSSIRLNENTLCCKCRCSAESSIRSVLSCVFFDAKINYELFSKWVQERARGRGISRNSRVKKPKQMNSEFSLEDFVHLRILFVLSSVKY